MCFCSLVSLFLSLNHCRIKSEILGCRYGALLLVEVHTQEYTFPHTSHHCQPPAVPVSVVIVGAEGERSPSRDRQSEILFT